MTTKMLVQDNVIKFILNYLSFISHFKSFNYLYLPENKVPVIFAIGITILKLQL